MRGPQVDASPDWLRVAVPVDAEDVVRGRWCGQLPLTGLVSAGQSVERRRRRRARGATTNTPQASAAAGPAIASVGRLMPPDGAGSGSGGRGGVGGGAGPVATGEGAVARQRGLPFPPRAAA